MANSQKKELDKELSDNFRIELKSDSEKDFGTEFKRTTNLENEIVNQYGFDGIKLIYESRNSKNYYELGKFPKECPWYGLNDKSNEEFIDSNFKPIGNKIPKTISAIKNRCKYIYAEKKEDSWELHYFLNMKLYDNRDYFKILTGGAPLIKAIPNSNLQTYNWSIPPDLKEFYSVHNGFGELINEYILGNEEIKVMAEMMDPICKEQNVFPKGYSFNELLEFYPDGTGNAQCFYKNGSNITVDWDHEIWEISWKVGFFEFIDERMSRIDEE